MTDQELRDKISDKVYEILRKSSTLQNGKRILTLDINGIEKVAERVAYSLVSIGIGDVSEWKHRAEVAELAAFNILNNTLQCVDCVVLKDGKCKVEKRDIANCAIKSLDIALQQAEKELQEERKDD